MLFSNDYDSLGCHASVILFHPHPSCYLSMYITLVPIRCILSLLRTIYIRYVYCVTLRFFLHQFDCTRFMCTDNKEADRTLDPFEHSYSDEIWKV